MNSTIKAPIDGVGIYIKSYVVEVIISFLTTLFLIFISAINPFVGLIFISLFTIVISTTRFGFLLVLFICFFQNFFISLVSPFVSGGDNFRILHAFNFAYPAIVLFAHVTKRGFSKLPLGYAELFICILVLLYFFYGTINFGFNNSVPYLRLFLIPILYFSLGKSTYLFIKEDYFQWILIFLLRVTLLLTILGIITPTLFFAVTNADSYYSLKLDDQLTTAQVLDYYRYRFFNLRILDFIRLFRFGSILNNFISFSYLTTILSIYAYYKGYRLLAIVAIICSIISSFSKGGVLYLSLFLIVAFWLRYNRFSFGTINLLLLPIWTLIVFVGYYLPNEHIVGFVEGAKFLLKTPFGNGLGFAGNLSKIKLTELNGDPLGSNYWDIFLNGTESSFGVLFSSLGVLSLVYILIILILLNDVFKVLKTENKIFSILALLAFYQGIFQEEAFSPYAIGLAMFLAGYFYKRAKLAVSRSI